ncbi:RNase H domain-containing protein [Trichonephila clavipes]|nr:RNase H domain-containing protein [Trichonephila clavipes]
MDSTGVDIISKLARLGQRKEVCLQWIPSHVGVPGNEAANELAGRGCDLPQPSSSVLSRSEVHSLHRAEMNLTWRNSPAHHWYAAKCPVSIVQEIQEALACFRSGRLPGVTFVQGAKSFFISSCFSCSSSGLLGQLFRDQDLVCDIIMRKLQMDLWCRLSCSKEISDNNEAESALPSPRFKPRTCRVEDR